MDLALVLEVAPYPSVAQASPLFIQWCRQLNTPLAGCGAICVEQSPRTSDDSCSRSHLVSDGDDLGAVSQESRHPPGSSWVSVVPLRPTCQRLANDSKAMR